MIKQESILGCLILRSLLKLVAYLTFTLVMPFLLQLIFLEGMPVSSLSTCLCITWPTFGMRGRSNSRICFCNFRALVYTSWIHWLCLIFTISFSSLPAVLLICSCSKYQALLLTCFLMEKFCHSCKRYEECYLSWIVGALPFHIVSWYSRFELFLQLFTSIIFSNKYTISCDHLVFKPHFTQWYLKTYRV